MEASYLRCIPFPNLMIEITKTNFETIKYRKFSFVINIQMYINVLNNVYKKNRDKEHSLD